jgi:hypothetical protein
VQQGCFEVAAFLHHGLLSAPSWRTVICIPPPLRMRRRHAWQPVNGSRAIYRDGGRLAEADRSEAQVRSYLRVTCETHRLDTVRE